MEPLSWQQGLICYSLLSATVPCLQAFLLKFYTFDFDTIRAMTSALQDHRREEVYKQALIKAGLLDDESHC